MDKHTDGTSYDRFPIYVAVPEWEVENVIKVSVWYIYIQLVWSVLSSTPLCSSHLTTSPLIPSPIDVPKRKASWFSLYAKRLSREFIKTLWSVCERSNSMCSLFLDLAHWSTYWWKSSIWYQQDGKSLGLRLCLIELRYGPWEGEGHVLLLCVYPSYHRMVSQSMQVILLSVGNGEEL